MSDVVFWGMLAVMAVAVASKCWKLYWRYIAPRSQIVARLHEHSRRISVHTAMLLSLRDRKDVVEQGINANTRTIVSLTDRLRVVKGTEYEPGLRRLMKCCVEDVERLGRELAMLKKQKLPVSARRRVEEKRFDRMRGLLEQRDNPPAAIATIVVGEPPEERHVDVVV